MRGKTKREDRRNAKRKDKDRTEDTKRQDLLGSMWKAVADLIIIIGHLVSIRLSRCELELQ